MLGNIINYAMVYSSAHYIGLILVVFASFLMMWAQFKVSSAYEKYSKINNMNEFTGYQIARSILDQNNLNDIEINMVKGKLSDHYNPKNRTVNLSEAIYNGTSIASVSVAAHEVGHALQHAENYAPLKFRTSILPLASLGSNLGWIIIMIGIIANAFNLAMIGIGLMCCMLLFQIATLPVEFNASARALTILEEKYIYLDEVTMSKKMLEAAAFTYIASVIVTLMSILRLLLIIINNSRRN
jgi:Predicted Zn-dependent protease